MSASRAGRIALAIVVSLTLVMGMLPATAAADQPAKPSSMAAAGDSITRGFNLCIFPFTDCVARSWSTGSNSTVNSHARRLGITGSAFNDARSGSKMIDLPGQATTVASRNVGYVTVLMGGNDVCTETEGAMTSPGTYEAQFRQAMNKFTVDPTPPLVYVVSIPNVKVLWEILKDSSSARSAWNSYGTCQSLLANPLSTAQVDVDRRERVKQRNMELNQRLRAACAAYSFCRFDGEAAFGTAFVPSDVSTRDYFHPSEAGQAKLAAVSYDNGYWGTKAPNLPPAPDFTVSCPTTRCTFTDATTDADVTAWSWNFDVGIPAGATSVQRNPVHTYPAPGTYSVTMHAIDALGATASVTKQVTVADGGSETTEPAPVGDLVATGGDGKVDLAWTANSTDADVAGYRVRRGDAAAGPYATISGDGLVTATTYTDTSVTNGTTYHYVVSVVDTSGNESDPSNVASATPVSAGGSTTSTIRVSDLDNVSAPGKGQSWTAEVAITIVNGNGQSAVGAAVTGNWTSGGSSSCTTGTGGLCTVSVSLNAKKTSSTTFSIEDVVLAGHQYTPGANSDGDGDSDGTSILIQR